MANVEEKKNELDDKKIFTSNAQRTTTVAKGETIIELKDVTIRFNKNNLKVDNLKEYFIRLVTKQLMFQEFIALKDIKEGRGVGLPWNQWCRKIHPAQGSQQNIEACQRYC